MLTGNLLLFENQNRANKNQSRKEKSTKRCLVTCCYLRIRAIDWRQPAHPRRQGIAKNWLDSLQHRSGRYLNFSYTGVKNYLFEVESNEVNFVICCLRKMLQKIWMGKQKQHLDETVALDTHSEKAPCCYLRIQAIDWRQPAHPRRQGIAKNWLESLQHVSGKYLNLSIPGLKNVCSSSNPTK